MIANYLSSTIKCFLRSLFSSSSTSVGGQQLKRPTRSDPPPPPPSVRIQVNPSLIQARYAQGILMANASQTHLVEHLRRMHPLSMCGSVSLFYLHPARPTRVTYVRHRMMAKLFCEPRRRRRAMSTPEQLQWPEELRLPELLAAEKVQKLHASIQEWGTLLRSACQTAAGRALWKQIVNDPLAEILAGENYLKSLHEKILADQIRRAREVSGVIIAVRTLWFDSKLENALSSFSQAQVVLLGAGMDTRAYRLDCLRRSSVFEVDFEELLETKEALLREALGSGDDAQKGMIMAESLTRVAADIREGNWLEKLQKTGFDSEKKTVWILEGILYYLSRSSAEELLKLIAENCSSSGSVLLADFMNESCISLSDSNPFQFLCDWPDHLLPTLGFSQVRLTQIGDPEAHFGLMNDPENLFNRLRKLPRSLQTNPEDGTPCRRLYLVEATVES